MIKLPPIYRRTWKLTIEILETGSKFPKQYRPTMARRLESASLDLLIGLRQSLLGSGDSFKNLLGFIDEIKVLMGVAFELRLLSPGRYENLNEEIVVIGKILGSLSKSSNKR